MDARYREQQRVGLSDATKGANLLATGVAFFTRGILIWLVFAIVDCACAASRARTPPPRLSSHPPFPAPPDWGFHGDLARNLGVYNFRG